MSTFAETRECPRCKGQLEHSEGNTPLDNYEWCLDCGYSYRTVIEQWELEEVNIERKGCNLPTLTEFKAIEWSDAAERVFQSEKTDR